MKWIFTFHCWFQLCIRLISVTLSKDLGSQGFGDLLACIRNKNIPLDRMHFVVRMFHILDFDVFSRWNHINLFCPCPFRQTYRNNLNKVIPHFDWLFFVAVWFDNILQICGQGANRYFDTHNFLFIEVILDFVCWLFLGLLGNVIFQPSKKSWLSADHGYCLYQEWALGNGGSQKERCCLSGCA